jgi:hypothetical protein
MENNRLGCINRDRNAVNNIKKIAEHWLKTGERLEKYRRQKLLTPLAIIQSSNSKPVKGTFITSQKLKGEKIKREIKKIMNENKTSQSQKVHSGI